MGMLGSLALLLVMGLLAGKIVGMLRLPELLGMLILGVLVGPYALNILDADLLLISQELRSFALIVILLRAGLGLKRESLAQVGHAAIRLSSIPCILEGVTVMVASRLMLEMSWIEAGEPSILAGYPQQLVMLELDEDEILEIREHAPNNSLEVYSASRKKMADLVEHFRKNPVQVKNSISLKWDLAI